MIVYMAKNKLIGEYINKNECRKILKISINTINDQLNNKIIKPKKYKIVYKL